MTKDQFKICFDDLFDAVRNYIYYWCTDQEVATDITQEAFMKLWEKKVDYEPNKVKGLLYHMAKQLWIDQLRKNASAQKYELTLAFKHSTDIPNIPIELAELKEQYERTLTNLPIKQREVFLMSRGDDLTYKEIAERLGISVKAVEKRMNIALQKLRKDLAYEQ